MMIFGGGHGLQQGAGVEQGGGEDDTTGFGGGAVSVSPANAFAENRATTSPVNTAARVLPRIVQSFVDGP
jgi:hypothetical protein